MKSVEILLSSFTETIVAGEPGAAASIYAVAWEPHTTAIIEAVTADYHVVTGRTNPTRQDLTALDGEAVTLLHHSPGLTHTALAAVHGRLTRTDDGRPAIRASDTENVRWVIDPDDVLDLDPDPAGMPGIRERVDRVRAGLPALEPLTRQDFQALPHRAPDPVHIGLVVFGTWRAEGTISTGAIWLLHSYDTENDIAEGYLIMRPEHGVNEHGSVLGRHLHHLGGRIINPPQLNLEDAVTLAGLPYREALARFVADQP